MGIDEVGIDKVGIDEVGRYHSGDPSLTNTHAQSVFPAKESGNQFAVWLS